MRAPPFRMIFFVVYHENPAFAMEFPCGAASGVIYYNKPGVS